MGEVTKTDMLLETEKMLGKHRFQDGSSYKKKKSDLTTADTREFGPSYGLLARGGGLNGPSNGPSTRGGNERMPPRQINQAIRREAMGTRNQ